MQIKDGSMRLIIPTVRGKHEFPLESIVSSENYETELPELFNLNKEAYILSKKENEFSFQKLSKFQEAVNDLNMAVLTENERHKKAKEGIAETFKDLFKEAITELTDPVVEKYKPELTELSINSVDPLQGLIVLEASKAQNPEDLKKIDRVTIPFDAHEKPEAIEESEFEEVPREEEKVEERKDLTFVKSPLM